MAEDRTVRYDLAESPGVGVRVDPPGADAIVWETEPRVGLSVDRLWTLAYEAGHRDARSAEQAAADRLADQLTEAEATIDRVRRFVDGFEARGDGLPLSTTDQLWIIAIRKLLDGDEVDRG